MNLILSEDLVKALADAIYDGLNRWRISYHDYQSERDALREIILATAKRVDEGKAVAWLHTVTQDDGETDQALSFSPDAFPLMGVGGFRSIEHIPLFYRSTAKRVEVDECLHACKRLHPHTQLRLTRSIAPDTNWHWTVVMPDGHTYDISKGPLTFEQAVTDLQGRGVIALDAADTIWRRNAALKAALGEGEGE